MCKKRLWPFRKFRDKKKEEKNAIDSNDDSSRRQHSSTASGGDSTVINERREVRAAPFHSAGRKSVRGISLIEGRWMQDVFMNAEAYYNAVATTNADLHAAKTYHEDTLFASFHPIDDEGLWVMEYESLQRGKIKNVLKMGEECDELTPHRQWVKSFFKMTSDNVMEGLRKYKNGTQAKVFMEVQSSNPDVLTVKTIVDDIISVFMCKRISN